MPNGSKKQQRRRFREKLSRLIQRNKKVNTWERPYSLREKVAIEDATGWRIGKVNNNLNLQFAAGIKQDRLLRYKEFEIMDMTSPMCANALDTYASNATLTDVLDNNVLQIETSDEELKEDLSELFFITLNVNYNLRSWIRQFCKYGDYVIRLYIDYDGKQGITDFANVNINEIAQDYDVTHGQKKPEKVYIWSENGLSPNTQHFINPFNYDMGKNSSRSQITLRQFEVLHFSIVGDSTFDPWGRSMLESARYPWKQLRLMEDSMLVYRVVRAPERRVFKLEVGNLPTEQIPEFVRQTMNDIKRVPIVDPDTGDINLQYNVHSVLEDFVFPQRNGFGSTIETLPGGQNTDAIQDVEYFKSLLRMALKVPKAFLEYDEMLTTARGLAKEDQRFASQISYIQQIAMNELYKAAVIHLISKGYDSERINSFTLRLVNASTTEEKDRLEILTLRNQLYGEMKTNENISEEWGMRNILKLSDQEIAEIMTGKLDDKRKAFIYAQLEQQGNVDGIFPGNPNGNAGELGGGKEMMGGLGGGGGSFGGGGFGGDMGLGGGGPEGGLGGPEMGLETSPEGGPLPTLGGGAGASNFEEFGGGGQTGLENMNGPGQGSLATNEPLENPTGGTEEAQDDPLRTVSDKLLKKTKQEALVRDGDVIGGYSFEDKVKANLSAVKLSALRNSKNPKK